MKEELHVRSAIEPFELALRARNLSARTIRSYRDTAEGFASFLGPRHGELSLEQIRDHHVNEFIADQLARWTASTAATRFRCLQQFFRFTADTYSVPSPMATLKPPKVPNTSVAILREPELVRLLLACQGQTFRDHRDHAILRLLIDTGIRREELAGIETNDVDTANQLILIRGKGGQLRFVSFGDQTASALLSYGQIRATHRHRSEPRLWLGPRGPLTGSGVASLIRRRSESAGIKGVFPHRFRHTFAHRWLVAGGGETDLQTLAGWQSRQMLERYGASARAERAALAHHRIRLGDSLRLHEPSHDLATG